MAADKLKTLATRIAAEGLTPALREEFTAFVVSLSPADRVAFRDVLADMLDAAKRVK